MVSPQLIAEGKRLGFIKPEMPPVGAHANYNHADYHFARQQSQKLRALEWEGREKPIQSYGDKALAGLLFGFVAGGYLLHLMGVW